jgi:uncharacterized protein
VKLTHHSIPAAWFEALATGGGGPDAIHELSRARYSKHLTLLAGVLRSAEKADNRQGQLTRQGFDLLTEVQRQHPDVARQMILHPSVGAWALRVTRSSLSDFALLGASPGRMSAVAAAAAIRAGLRTEIEVEAADGVVMLPSLGSAAANEGTVVVHCGKGRAEILSPGQRVIVPSNPHRDGPGWHGLRQVRTGTLDVIIDDLDSFRMPSSPDLAPRLSAIDMSKFTEALRLAWPLLESAHADVAAECALAIKVIVPLTMFGNGHVSSSSSATFGAIAMSEPPDPYTCASTFAHEMQHLKLSALLDVVRLTQPDDGQLYYAPWRSDPRPIGGLLQGAYAFLGVSGFWRRQRQLVRGEIRLRAETEFARWREATASAIQTLRSSGRLTSAGLRFVEGMAKTADGWRDERVLPEAQSMARQQAHRHLTDWQAENGPAPAPDSRPLFR